MKSPLKGIIPPMITPLNNYNELDHQGLNNLIEHLNAAVKLRPDNCYAHNSINTV